MTLSSRTTIVAGLAVTFVFGASGYSSSSPNSMSKKESSESLERIVRRPEALSGIWEAPNGQGGAVGIQLHLIATAPGDAKTLHGTLQRWKDLKVGVYERKGAQIQLGEENFFSDSPNGGAAFEDGRLRVNFGTIDLDLLQVGDVWTGRLHRESFDSAVILRRPSVSDGANTSRVVGTWRENSQSPSIFSCVHIVQQGQSDFIGWSDALVVAGLMSYANELARPETTIESYGELMKVDSDSAGKVRLELYAFSGICCSHVFVGKLDQNGGLIEGDWPASPKQSPHPGSWTKMPGDSCTVPIRSQLGDKIEP